MSTATAALCPLKRLLALLRPCRISGSDTLTTRSFSVPSLIWQPPSGFSSTSCAIKRRSRAAAAAIVSPCCGWAACACSAQQPPGILHDRRQQLLALFFVVPVNRRLAFQAAAKVATQALPLRPRRSRLPFPFRQPARQVFDPFRQQIVGVLHRPLAQDRGGVQRHSDLATLQVARPPRLRDRFLQQR